MLVLETGDVTPISGAGAIYGSQEPGFNQRVADVFRNQVRISPTARRHSWIRALLPTRIINQKAIAIPWNSVRLPENLSGLAITLCRLTAGIHVAFLLPVFGRPKTGTARKALQELLCHRIKRRDSHREPERFPATVRSQIRASVGASACNGLLERDFLIHPRSTLR